MVKTEKTLIHYIPKVLKNVSECDITYNAKHQLNAILLRLAEAIVLQSVNMLKAGGKTTLTVKTLVNTVRIMFTGDLTINILKEGDFYIKMDTLKQVRETLIFPPAFFRHLIEHLIPSRLKVSYKFPIYLASLIEYICAEVLELGAVQAYKREHLRLTPQDLSLAIHHDYELSHVVRKYNIVVVGKPLVFPKASFNHMVRKLCNAIDDSEVKIAKPTFTLLQSYIEHVIVQLIQQTHTLCVYNGKNKMTQKDLEFIFSHT